MVLINISAWYSQQQQYLFASKGGLPEEHQLSNAGHPKMISKVN